MPFFAMFMNICRKRSGAAILFLLVCAGCSGSSQIVSVVERPGTTEPVSITTSLPPGEEEASPVSAPADVEIGRFDTGKMWTFEDPPVGYFEEAYGFKPDSAWFARARLGALRLPNCSASFVSPQGLILTNHHCARESIADVTREGETLLDNGFYADSTGAERKVEDLYVDQLVAIEDVTEQVYGLVRYPDDENAGSRRRQGRGERAMNSDDRSAAARGRRLERIETRMNAEAQGRDSLLTVQVVELYHGGRYSAYTFRRYDDIRLVFAPELPVGAFGGDPDNFTYPRYSFDFSFFRAYDSEGEPLSTPHYFAWDKDGAQEGEAVFVVGNPGTTSRLETVGQLEFERDYMLPAALDALKDRMRILEEYIAEEQELTQENDLRNASHQISNQFKKNEGELTGLRDSLLIARRVTAERKLVAEIAAVDSLQEKYGHAIGEIARLQRSKEAMADQNRAFLFFGAPAFDSHVLVRSAYGYIISLMRQRGMPADEIEDVLEDALDIEDWPPELEKRMLAVRLHEFLRHLGENDPTVNRLLQGQTPEEAADRIISGTALRDSAKFAVLLEEGFLGSGDPAEAMAQAVTPLFLSIQQQISGLDRREQELNALLSLARFALYGAQIPPDATFSLRIADGVVAGYPYNGTTAPSHTTLFGMYDHYYSYGGEDTDWDLPDQWLHPPDSLDRSTAVNLVTTNDITGGNSGSPLLDKELRIVGVVFDSNIDALPNTYVYLDEQGRAVSVDARGIIEVLEHMYGADRIVSELLSGADLQGGDDISARSMPEVDNMKGYE